MLIIPPSWATRTFKTPDPPPEQSAHVMPARRYITTPSAVSMSDLAWMYYRNHREWPRIFNANRWLGDPNGVIPQGTTLEIP